MTVIELFLFEIHVPIGFTKVASFVFHVSIAAELLQRKRKVPVILCNRYLGAWKHRYLHILFYTLASDLRVYNIAMRPVLIGYPSLMSS